ncbi:MAG TPA: hypothetical protein VE988_07240 [Gemmataceae bacterium]|nr:hypothetical protein [Gemmataceae bacterium]
MGALAQKDVGDYLNKYFVSSYQKIASFTVTAGGQKQGGNVASYFCTPEGRVLHVVVGPVSGEQLLKEARWVEETWKLAEMHELKTVEKLQILFRHAHLERLATDFNIHVKPQKLPRLEPANAATIINGPYVNTLLNHSPNQQGKVHLLLAGFTLPKIGRVYGTVFETILNQEISTVPVVQTK